MNILKFFTNAACCPVREPAKRKPPPAVLPSDAPRMQPGFRAEKRRSDRFFHFGAVSSFFWATFVPLKLDYKG
ncbi:MAG: hypothetical protein EGQ86_13070 [Alistipes sp.]|nr:hypothetical protein [Alistipes sp.]